MTEATCAIGSYGAHTWNFERTECIWCGPRRLASQPGVWRSIGDGFYAWQSPALDEQVSA